MVSTILFCGGGSGGHVMPALTLIERIKMERPELRIEYIGSYKGIERELAVGRNIPYHAIHTGKIRRYLSLENIIDQFKVVMGLFQSLWLLAHYSSSRTVIFSTGGFVSVPVVIAAWITGKKVYVHEQTARIGLANKIASHFAEKFFISFEETRRFLPAGKVIFSGYPLRDSLYCRDIERVEIQGQCLNDVHKPLLMVTGGGNGSVLMNDLVLKHFEKLKERFVILHQIGKQDFERFATRADKDYLPVQFLSAEMVDCMKLASVVVARAGAGTVCEIMALKKKCLFIPLKIAQKNEQFHNAMEAKRRIGSAVIEEDQLEHTDLIRVLDKLLKDDSVASNSSWEEVRAQDIILGEVLS